MAVEVSYPHIVKSPGEPARLARQPRTRVAQIVMDYTEYGWSADEIQRQHPYLSLAEVHSALAYYFDHVEEMDREIEEEWKVSQRLANATPRPRHFLPACKPCSDVMPTRLYLDVHVPLVIGHQLRQRGVDGVRALEEGTNRLEDEELRIWPQSKAVWCSLRTSGFGRWRRIGSDKGVLSAV